MHITCCSMWCLFKQGEMNLYVRETLQICLKFNSGDCWVSNLTQCQGKRMAGLLHVSWRNIKWKTVLGVLINLHTETICDAKQWFAGEISCQKAVFFPWGKSSWVGHPHPYSENEKVKFSRRTEKQNNGSNFASKKEADTKLKLITRANLDQEDINSFCWATVTYFLDFGRLCFKTRLDFSLVCFTLQLAAGLECAIIVFD